MAKFKRGDQVEVCGKGDGFRNSFYAATIISQINPTEFIVQYNTLLSEDELHPLREFLTIDELRPVPPEIDSNCKLELKDEVDAFANDGWWKGMVKKKAKGRGKAAWYYVSFQDNGVELEVCSYLRGDLRLHQDWIDGNWICSSKNFS